MFQLLWSPPICMNGWIILVLATITAGLDAHLSTWLTQEYQLSVSEAGFTFLAISIPGLVLSPLGSRMSLFFSTFGLVIFLFCCSFLSFPLF
ncbi:hypothetical protein HMI55_005998 [Coelomomyces lativittatus]|nr:hypothetical protein HMI55_005998 [Coelomomyces lativittatus]